LGRFLLMELVDIGLRKLACVGRRLIGGQRGRGRRVAASSQERGDRQTKEIRDESKFHKN